jgi:hypothetical protein
MPPATAQPQPPGRSFELHRTPTRAAGLLCGDAECPSRVRPTTDELAAALAGDNALSAAIGQQIDAAWRTYASERFAEQETRMGELDAKLDANTATTHEIKASTADIVDLMNSWRGAMKTIDGLGKVLRPLTWIVGFCTALVGLWAALRAKDGG